MLGRVQVGWLLGGAVLALSLLFVARIFGVLHYAFTLVRLAKLLKLAGFS